MSDIRADTFDTIDGQHWLWHSDDPDTRYEVVGFVDRDGNEQSGPEGAFGGVVEIHESCFMTFTFKGALN